MKANNNLIAENMDAYLNADIQAIVRTYRDDMIQDAILGFEGSLLTSVHDASMPYWRDAVATFPEGDYTLDYDKDGRLVKDDTRDISAISYHSFGNLPYMIKSSDGSYIASSYLPDGSLLSRSMMTRTIEIVTKVDSKGDTILTERLRNKIATHSYRGNYELTPGGTIYHTATGHYDFKTGKYYRYVRDRLGSTVAVTDSEGKPVQATGYYPSGTLCRITALELATEVDVKTDRLHLGNRSMRHKSFKKLL